MTFRDATLGALERISSLEQENAELREEIAQLKAEREELREDLARALSDDPEDKAPDSGPPVLLADKMRAFLKKLNEPFSP